MIITKNIRITRIVSGTWKSFLFLLTGCILCYFLNEYVLKEYFKLPAIIPSILGPALAFFIGFNNNQAYDRWWEARKIWGSLVNDSRTWARQLIYYPIDGDNKFREELHLIIKRTVHRHIAFLYALKENLRGETNKDYRKYISKEESELVERESNIHNAILNQQSKDLNDIYARGWVDGFKFTEMNKMIVGFSNEMGKSERIKNTVFPTTYNYYTRFFIWFLVIATVMVLANLTGAWSILFGTLIGYVFLTTHKIGQAILNPFEPIPSEISLDQITRTIEINLLKTLGGKEIPNPIKSVKNEYIM